jgi:xeroderma pigmentosum group C-complementing protein
MFPPLLIYRVASDQTIGAVHVPYRGTVRVCKRLEIDYAEAVVGFEFGHRMAVPVIQGVVIAQENYERLIEELEKDEAERARKEDEKRRKAALGTWRKFLMGLRIAEQIRQDYGHLGESESVDVFAHESANQEGTELDIHDESMAGGFLPEGYEEEGLEKEESRQTSAFFAAAGAYDEDDEGEDPFQVEYHGHTTETKPGQAQISNSNTEQNLEPEAEPQDDPQNGTEVEPEDVPAKTRKQAVPKSKAKPRRSTRRRTRKKQVGLSDEDEDETL